MLATTPTSPLVTYDEAARLLGIQRASVKQLVARGRLHSIPAPEDRRRRLLTRAEVEAYARNHAGKWSYTQEAAPPQPAPEAPVQPPPLSKEFVVAGAASVGTAALLIEAFRREPELTARLVLIGAVAAIALLLFLEWRRQGKLSAAQAHRLETLAKQADTKPERFLSEFEQWLTTA
jgi:excisionase family DNA binding protein